MLKSSPLIGRPLYNDWDKETMTLTAITSHGGKIGTLWNTQILIVTYAIRPALVINWVCFYVIQGDSIGCVHVMNP